MKIESAAVLALGVALLIADNGSDQRAMAVLVFSTILFSIVCRLVNQKAFKLMHLGVR